MSLFFPDDTDDMYDYLPGEFVYGDDAYIPEEYMEEKWWYTDVPGYMISDKGRVWSTKTKRFLTPKKADKHGHKGYCLHHNGTERYEYAHRLVAKAFIRNQVGHPNVLHRDDDPDYNWKNNLYWGTQADNHRDCVTNGHYKAFTDEAREKSAEKTRKPIIATNLETGEETYYRGQNEAARILGLQQSNIGKVLHGERAQTCGYAFRFVNAHLRKA